MNAAAQRPKLAGLRDDTTLRRAILVLGMHRSGTSAVARCLNLLGADLGSDLLPAAEGNPKGFWEQAEIVRVHEALLASLGRTWSDTRGLPKGWIASPAAQTARSELGNLVRRDFGDSSLWAVKDPRMCRFVPLWREVLGEQGIEASAVLVARHPAEVARSLRARDGIPLETAFLSWLEHFAEAESDTRSMPRSLVLYEDLLADWQRALYQVGQELGMEWPRSFNAAQPEIDAFLEAGERHHHASQNMDFVPELPTQLYVRCRSRNNRPDGWKDISQLVDDYRLMAPTFLGRDEHLVDELRESERRARSAERAIAKVLDGFDSSAAEAKAIQQAARCVEDQATLYFRAPAEEFSELRAQRSTRVWDGPDTTFKFELPADKRLACLRFDPAQRSGAFCVDELRINGVPVRDLATRVCRLNQVRLEQAATNGVCFASYDNDPLVEFDLADLVTQSGSTLAIEIDCRRWDLEQMIAPFMMSMLSGLRREIEAGTQLLRSQAVAADVARQREEALRSAAEREAQLREQAEARHTRLEADLAAAREHEQRVEQEMSRLERQLETERAAAAELQSDNAVLRETQTQAQIAGAAVAAELSAIKSSTSWRALVRLRSALLRVPPRQRMALRRAAKAMWWTVTPWRMPERLRFLAQRRAGSQGALQERAGQIHFAAPKYNYTPLTMDAKKISSEIAALRRRTSFSVIVPVYNTDPELLKRTVASVETQWYPDWELVLVDDHSPAPHVQQTLSSLQDSRIMAIRLPENKGISGATNEGIAHAHGDFIVFLDHDDELTPDCLYELARCIDREDPDYLYSDEDKLDVDGSFKDPFFKPDWSPDTLMSTMYTCHVSCVRRSLALKVGGLRSEYDGSQDWDFVLRLADQTNRISHIPKVLYHWRIIPESCATDLRAKPYAIDASKRAREDALRRRGLVGELVPVPELPGYFRAHYLLQGEPLFSIIIPSKNNGAVLKTCIDSIFEKTAYPHFEVVVIDNGSSDSSTLRYLKTLRKRERVILLHHALPFNYSEINNFGARHASGEILVFLNDDTEVLSSDWLDYMGGYARLPHVGAVGAKLLYPGRHHAVQHSGVINLASGPSHAFLNLHASQPGYFNRNLLEYDWLAVTGACMMIEKKKFEMVGGFDEELAIAYNDMDLCFSLHKANFFQVVCPNVMLIHHESLTRGDDTANARSMARLERERAALFRKHPGLVGRDPFHNPNLDPDDVHFGIRLGSHAFEDCDRNVYQHSAPQTNIQFGLDVVDEGRATDVIRASRLSPLTLVGWLGDGRGNAAGDFAALLEDGSRSYCALARTRVPRPDVAKALRCDGLANSGFRITVSMTNVLPGTYKLLAVKPGDPAVACTLASKVIVQPD